MHLAGVLDLPAGDTPAPGLLFVPGSGKNDRDETVCGKKPFLALSAELTRRGYAVLRTDDRGVGRSGGDKDAATLEQLLDDVAAALAFLRAHPRVRADRTALLGHSEGGVIAAGHAAGDERLAGLILLASPGLPCATVLHRQTEQLSRAAGATEEQIAHERAMNEAVFARLDSGAGAHPDESCSDVQEMLIPFLRGWPGAPTASDAELRRAAATMAAVVCTVDFRRFLRADPASDLARVGCPVLAVCGSRDLQVEAAPNLGAIRAALQRSRRDAHEIIELPGVNHILQDAVTGTIEEYAAIEHTLSPRVVEAVVGWLSRHLPTQPGAHLR